MKILMFGWEFPPFNSGGLGVACEGLVKALSKSKTKILFVLPKKIKLNNKSDDLRFIFADDLSFQKEKKYSNDGEKNKNIKTISIDSLITPYATFSSYAELYKNIIFSEKNKTGLISLIYGKDLLSEVMRYAEESKKIIEYEDFDIIHCHDWLCYPAGIIAKKISKRPLVAHIHATEIDRTGTNNINSEIYKIEKEGFEEADKIIAVSHFTKDIVVKHYDINPDKIKVVHNAVDFEEMEKEKTDVICGLKKSGKKIVLFLGRITMQKGPDYFLLAAKKVLEINPDVIFIIAGSGDMEIKIIEMAAVLGIADKVLFTGFLRGKDRYQAYQMADLYVLPSVSEPFGITPLESLAVGTPVLISKQSGVSEIISHCIRADFWDINDIANKIISVISHPELKNILGCNGMEEIKKISWRDAGKKCRAIYEEVLKR